MPLWRTDTGCKCRKTLVNITITRFRRSRGAGWRKTLFRPCHLRMKSPTDMRCPLYLDVRFFVGPFAAFLLELLALVDDQLAVVADTNGPALQRPGSGAFEIDAGNVKTAAVARALEFLLALQPLGRAAKVRAGRA